MGELCPYGDLHVEGPCVHCERKQLQHDVEMLTTAIVGWKTMAEHDRTTIDHLTDLIGTITEHLNSCPVCGSVLERRSHEDTCDIARALGKEAT